MSQEIHKSKYVTIATDAWADVNGQSVINFIVMALNPVFYKAIYTKNNPHTTTYLPHTTAELIREIGASKVVAVITDNAKANVAAWDTLVENFKEMQLYCGGCAAHWLSLMAKDILKIEAFGGVLKKHH